MTEPINVKCPSCDQTLAAADEGGLVNVLREHLYEELALEIPLERVRENVAAKLRDFDGYNARPISGAQKLSAVVELVGSDEWPRDALVLAVYPVDDFDLRRAVADHQRRSYAIPSFVELIGAKYRLVPVSGPPCVVPFVGCRIVRREGFFVDAVNAQVTPLVGLRPTVPSRSRPVGRGQKGTFATTMIIAGGVKVK
jgi:hypothetical protein